MSSAPNGLKLVALGKEKRKRVNGTYVSTSPLSPPTQSGSMEKGPAPGRNDYGKKYVRATQGVYTAITNMSYKQCLCELIENSLQACKGVRQAIISIHIDLQNRCIEFVDNGKGATKEDEDMIAMVGASKHRQDKVVTDKVGPIQHLTPFFGKYGVGGACVFKFGTNKVGAMKLKVTRRYKTKGTVHEYGMVHEYNGNADEEAMYDHLEPKAVPDDKDRSYFKITIDNVGDEFFNDYKENYHAYVKFLSERYHFWLHGFDELNTLLGPENKLSVAREVDPSCATKIRLRHNLGGGNTENFDLAVYPQKSENDIRHLLDVVGAGRDGVVPKTKVFKKRLGIHYFCEKTETEVRGVAEIVLWYFPRDSRGESMPNMFKGYGLANQRVSGHQELSERNPGLVTVWQDVILHEETLTSNNGVPPRMLWFMNHVRGTSRTFYRNSFIRNHIPTSKDAGVHGPLYRVKGFLFLTDTCLANTHKTALEPETTMYKLLTSKYMSKIDMKRSGYKDLEFRPAQEDLFTQYSDKMKEWTQDDQDGSCFRAIGSVNGIDQYKCMRQNSEIFEAGNRVFVSRSMKSSELPTVGVIQFFAQDKDNNGSPILHYYKYDDSNKSVLRETAFYLQHCDNRALKKYLEEIKNKKPCAVQMVNYVSNQKEPELLKYSHADKITLLTEKIGSGDFKQFISCRLKNKKGKFLLKSEGSEYCVRISKKIDSQWKTMTMIKKHYSSSTNLTYSIRCEVYQGSEFGREQPGKHIYKIDVYPKTLADSKDEATLQKFRLATHQLHIQTYSGDPCRCFGWFSHETMEEPYHNNRKWKVRYARDKQSGDWLSTGFRYAKYDWVESKGALEAFFKKHKMKSSGLSKFSPFTFIKGGGEHFCTSPNVLYLGEELDGRCDLGNLMVTLHDVKGNKVDVDDIGKWEVQVDIVGHPENLKVNGIGKIPMDNLRIRQKCLHIIGISIPKQKISGELPVEELKFKIKLTERNSNTLLTQVTDAAWPRFALSTTLESIEFKDSTDQECMSVVPNEEMKFSVCGFDSLCNVVPVKEYDLACESLAAVEITHEGAGVSIVSGKIPEVSWGQQGMIKIAVQSHNGRRSVKGIRRGYMIPKRILKVQHNFSDETRPQLSNDGNIVNATMNASMQPFLKSSFVVVDESGNIDQSFTGKLVIKCSHTEDTEEVNITEGKAALSTHLVKRRINSVIDDHACDLRYDFFATSIAQQKWHTWHIRVNVGDPSKITTTTGPRSVTIGSSQQWDQLCVSFLDSHAILIEKNTLADTSAKNKLNKHFFVRLRMQDEGLFFYEDNDASTRSINKDIHDVFNENNWTGESWKLPLHDVRVGGKLPGQNKKVKLLVALMMKDEEEEEPKLLNHEKMHITVKPGPLHQLILSYSQPFSAIHRRKINLQKFQRHCAFRMVDKHGNDVQAFLPNDLCFACNNVMIKGYKKGTTTHRGKAVSLILKKKSRKLTTVPGNIDQIAFEAVDNKNIEKTVDVMFETPRPGASVLVPPIRVAIAPDTKAPCTFALDGLNPDQFNAQSYTIILKKGISLERATVLKEDQSLVQFKMLVLNEEKKKVNGFSKHIWCFLRKGGQNRSKNVIKRQQIGSFSKLIKKIPPGKYNVDFILIAEKVWKSLQKCTIKFQQKGIPLEILPGDFKKVNLMATDSLIDDSSPGGKTIGIVVEPTDAEGCIIQHSQPFMATIWADSKDLLLQDQETSPATPMQLITTMTNGQHYLHIPMRPADNFDGANEEVRIHVCATINDESVVGQSLFHVSSAKGLEKLGQQQREKLRLKREQSKLKKDISLLKKEIRKIETNIAIKEDHAKNLEKKKKQVEAKIRGNNNIFERLRNELEQCNIQIKELNTRMDAAKANHRHIPLRYDNNAHHHQKYHQIAFEVRSRVGQRRGDGLLGLTNDLGFFSRGVGNICAIHIGKAFGFVVTNEDMSRTLERDWDRQCQLTPTVKTLEAARFKLETMRNKPNIANGTSQKFLVYPIQLRHQSGIRSVRGAIQTLPDGVMAKYAANLVTIPESILYEFPSIRLEVWYFHYFRNLIIFQTKHGAETFVDFHRKRIQHYRNSRHQSRQQSARAEYEVSVALLEYPIRCVDDPNFFRQGSRGIRLGSRRFTASFTFGNPDIRHTKGFQDLNAKHGNIQQKIEEIEGAIDENKISNLQEEMRDLDSELSELQSEITGMEEERENQVADTRELELKLKNLGTASRKRKADANTGNNRAKRR